MAALNAAPGVAIACGGTGGHLFPGLAVARALQRSGMRPLLVISPKEVDQAAVRGEADLEVLTVPAVGWTGRNPVSFVRGFWEAGRLCGARFGAAGVRAVLGMGGFTSAPPLLAGRRLGAATFLHESNAIPGRANRFAARWVNAVFVGLEMAVERLPRGRVTVTGTPVRPQFVPREAAGCRVELGLDPADPVLLVAGGSQGAAALNTVVVEALPALRRRLPRLQFVHLTGTAGFTAARDAHAAAGSRAWVRPFSDRMEVAMGAATLALSRAGASSLSELAAMRLPAILVPYPAAADDHQRFNALEYVRAGAARRVDQVELTAERLVAEVENLVEDAGARRGLAAALERCHRPDATEQIAGAIRRELERRGVRVSGGREGATSATGGEVAVSRGGRCLELV